MTVKGFMGKTHAVLSIMLLCVCLFVPINIFKETIWLLKDNILFFCIGIVVTVGGALLPDMDNAQSAAGSTLGFMGNMFTTFMQSTASMIYSLFHLRSDSKSPFFPHRYFWHTGFAGIGLLLLFWIGLPSGEMKILDDIKEQSISEFLQARVVILFFAVFLFMAILCGSNMIMYNLIKWFKLPKALNYILPTAICAYLFFIDYSHLKTLGICLGLGYIFHCIEDCFADSGVPFLWPIPIKRQAYHRVKFFITCQTGGLANTIVDIVVLIIDIGLIALIFLRGVTL